MIKHCLNVSGQKIYGTNKVLLASDANGTVGFKFNFDSEWKKLENKAAVFQRPGEDMLTLVIEDSFVFIPWEILSKAEPFFLSVIAYSGQKLLTTQKCVMAVADSALPIGMKPSSPTEDIFSKFKNETEEKVRAEYDSRLKGLEKDLAKSNEELGVYKETNETLKAQNETLKSEKENLSDENKSVKRELTLCKAANYVLQERAKQSDAWDEFWENSENVSGMFNLTASTRVLGKKIPYLNTLNITDASCMIGNEKRAGCNTEKINMRFDKVKTMAYFAANNQTVTDITLSNITSALENMNYAFYNCTKLKNIDAEFDMTNAIYVFYAFTGCKSLEKIRLKENTLRVNIDFGACENLTLESLLSILNSLSPNAVKKTLTLSSFSKMVLRNSDFSYNDGEKTYYGDVAYYWAVIDKGWSFSGWTV